MSGLPDSGVWHQKEWLDFAHKHEMSYVTNYGARVDARGRRNHHKSSFTIASNSKRVLEHFANGKKAGDYCGEHSDSATSAVAHQFAEIVVEALYPQRYFKSIPHLGQASALITRNLSRREWQAEPKALEAIAKEAEGLRQNGTWDDSSVQTLHQLRGQARSQGRKLRVAELMTLCGVKHAELAPELQKFKGRIVYRGIGCLMSSTT